MDVGVALYLTAQEARWLRDWMQNGTEDETAEGNTMRRKFWIALGGKDPVDMPAAPAAPPPPGTEDSTFPFDIDGEIPF